MKEAESGPGKESSVPDFKSVCSIFAEFHLRVICYFKTRRKRQIPCVGSITGRSWRTDPRKDLCEPNQVSGTAARKGVSRMMPQTRLAWAIEQIQH